MTVVMRSLGGTRYRRDAEERHLEGSLSQEGLTIAVQEAFTLVVSQIPTQNSEWPSNGQVLSVTPKGYTQTIY
jgi:hypothetical protein